VERLNKVIESSPEYEHHKPAPTTAEDKEHELAAWLNNLNLEGEEGEGEEDVPRMHESEGESQESGTVQVHPLWEP
jgi:hypothetical protein